MKNYSITSHGFSLLELLIVAVIVVIGTTWSIPQYRRQLALSRLDQYTQQIESGLFSLRARQSAEGTSCQLLFNPSHVGIDNIENGYGRPSDVLELSHLTQQQRHQRLLLDQAARHRTRRGGPHPARGRCRQVCEAARGRCHILRSQASVRQYHGD